MTKRGFALLLASTALVASGLLLRWPEASALGAAGAALVVLTSLLGSRPIRAEIAVDRTDLRVVRGRSAAVRLSIVTPRRRRGALRVVDGELSRPLGSVRVPTPGAHGRIDVFVPVDTSERGRWAAGPYTVVQGDPWGIVRKVAGRSEAGTLTVHPRTFPVRRSMVTSPLAGESESASRRLGDEHFFALREYVLGDEPRTVHWRSSARAGQLMVRQQVAAATFGTTIILDPDITAYVSESRFGSGADRERFEVAVEVAASVAAAQAASEPVHLVIATDAPRITSAAAGSTNRILDVLATVQPLAPVVTMPEELPRLVRRTRCARVVLVSGSPGQKTLRSLTAVSRIVPATVLIRVGASEPKTVFPGRVVDVVSAEDLS